MLDKIFKKKAWADLSSIDKNILEKLTTEQTPISISFDNNSEQFLSTIDSINYKKGNMVLTELKPDEANDKIINASNFEINTTASGIPVTFKSTHLKTEFLNNEFLHFCSLPTDFVYNQRRDAFRVPITKDEDLQLVVFIPGSTKLSAKVIDISISGMRIASSGNLSRILHNGQILYNCKLYLNEGAPLNCSLEIKHFHYSGENSETIMGVRFVNRSNELEQILSRLIVKLQRETVKASKIPRPGQDSNLRPVP